MTVTAVEPRKKSMSALYIDGEHAVDIDRETLLLSPFKPGSVITDEQLKALIDESGNKRAGERALYLLGVRDYCGNELFLKLSDDFGEDAAYNAVVKMERLGLIDDEEYTKKLARDLIERKKLSANRAVIEMARKGIDRDMALETVSDMDVDEVQTVKALIERKYYKSLTDEKGIKRTVAALARKGYSYGVIKEAMREFDED